MIGKYRSWTSVLDQCNFWGFLGTREERGIAAWQEGDDEAGELNRRYYNEGYEVYLPLLPKSLLNHKITKYIPFLPYTGSDKGQMSKDSDIDGKSECRV